LKVVDLTGTIVNEADHAERHQHLFVWSTEVSAVTLFFVAFKEDQANNTPNGRRVAASLLQEKWCVLIQHAKTQHTLHHGKYGGRSGCDAKILAFLEELKMEICYASQKSLINFDNDAASCYDQIIPLSQA
jgi:hypothetical protein